MDIKKLLDIMSTMIDYGMLDKNRINDVDYVVERVQLYLEAKNFVDTNFKGCFFVMVFFAVQSF